MKVKRIRVKSVLVVSSQHSDATSLREHSVSVSICERRVERIPSSRQRRSKDGDSVAIACAYSGKKGAGEMDLMEDGWR